MNESDTVMTALQIGEKVTLIGFLIASLFYAILKMEKCSKENKSIVTSNTEAVSKLCHTLDGMDKAFHDMRLENQNAHEKVFEGITDIKIELKTKTRRSA
jgi:hypothetical protein